MLKHELIHLGSGFVGIAVKHVSLALLIVHLLTDLVLAVNVLCARLLGCEEECPQMWLLILFPISWNRSVTNDGTASRFQQWFRSLKSLQRALT